MRQPRSRPLLALLILLTTLALACSGATEAFERLSGGSKWTDVSELERTDSPAAEVAGDQPPATRTAGRKSPTPTPIVAATATTLVVTDTPPTASSQAQALQLIDQGFRQEGDTVSYAFLVTNPNQELALEGTPYELAAYTENGTVAAKKNGYLSLIAPQQTTAYASTLSLEENSNIASITVQLGEGRVVVDEPLPEFAIEGVRTFLDSPNPSLTAILTNPDQRAFNDIRLSAVFYDRNDHIRGGGFTFINFVPANSATGLRMYVNGLPDMLGDGGRVELYPQLSMLSTARASQMPPDAITTTLVQSGFGSNGRELSYAALLENHNNGYNIEGLRYRATAYAADGSVLGVNDGYVPDLPAAQTMGFSGSIFLVTTEPVDHVEVQLGEGRFVPPDSSQQPFVTEEAHFRPGHSVNYVTGFVVNPYEQTVTDLFVSALLYNNAGQIIGSGLTYLDEATPRGRTAVEVRVITSSEPASVELYATLSPLSQFR